MLLLCPPQRKEVHEQKVQLGSSHISAVCYVVLFVSLFALTIGFNVLVMMPSTRCLVIVGGGGC